MCCVEVAWRKKPVWDENEAKSNSFAHSDPIIDVTWCIGTGLVKLVQAEARLYDEEYWSKQKPNESKIQRKWNVPEGTLLFRGNQYDTDADYDGQTTA